MRVSRHRNHTLVMNLRPESLRYFKKSISLLLWTLLGILLSSLELAWWGFGPCRPRLIEVNFLHHLPIWRSISRLWRWNLRIKLVNCGANRRWFRFQITVSKLNLFISVQAFGPRVAIFIQNFRAFLISIAIDKRVNNRYFSNTFPRQCKGYQIISTMIEANIGHWFLPLFEQFNAA